MIGPLPYFSAIVCIRVTALASRPKFSTAATIRGRRIIGPLEIVGSSTSARIFAVSTGDAVGSGFCTEVGPES